MRCISFRCNRPVFGIDDIELIQLIFGNEVALREIAISNGLYPFQLFFFRGGGGGGEMIAIRHRDFLARTHTHDSHGDGC